MNTARQSPDRPLHIGMTADPVVPVPPVLYGGIERIIDFLIRGLAERGHRITLFAHPESRIPGTLVPFGVPPHEGPLPRARELWQLSTKLIARHRQFDVVHSIGRLAALAPLLPLRSVPKVQSYMRDTVPWRSIRIASRLGGRSVAFTGLSTSVYRERDERGAQGSEWHTIFAGVETGKYTPVAHVPADAPLVFLGRVERIKGPHDAIAIARAAGRRLIIAGNLVRTGADPNYYEREIAPHVDGTSVTYVGPLDDAGKNDLLGRGAALLFPIDVEEAFGIVMAEAFACGTPVIGYARGSVPEVVRVGINGFVCRDVPGAVAAVARLGAIDRRRVRADCEERFANESIVSQYETLYRDLVARRA